MGEVVRVSHPLIEHHLADLRQRDTVPSEFRRLIGRLAVLLAYEATKDLLLSERHVQTPMAETTGKCLSQRVGLVPILRAGLGMIDPVLELIPTAEVWHLGLYRDEQTAEPVEYYSKIPLERRMDVALVLDPMLATGGSAGLAIETLHKRDVPVIKLLSIIASAEGIATVTKRYPETQIYVCAIDPQMNAQKFILPGLGDAGDRIFNT